MMMIDAQMIDNLQNNLFLREITSVLIACRTWKEKAAALLIINDRLTHNLQKIWAWGVSSLGICIKTSNHSNVLYQTMYYM